ncbi:hypothetical protein V3C99_016522 [Haemonchus contortus]
MWRTSGYVPPDDVGGVGITQQSSFKAIRAGIGG